MANKTPSWCPDAIATPYGWAHPLTGEQLVSHKALEDTVDYYLPNAGPYSFLDPQSEVRSILSSMARGRKAILQVNSLEKVVSVTWTIDGQVIEGGPTLVYQFQEDGLFWVDAEVSVEIDGTPDIVNLSSQVRVGPVPDVVLPELESVSIYGGENGDVPVAVGVEAWVAVSFAVDPDWNTITQTTTWEIDGVTIPDAIGRYTPTEGDVGKTLTATVTVTNSAGSVSMTSDGVVVLPAPEPDPEP